MKWNTEYQVEVLRYLFESSVNPTNVGNPAHAWWAIYFCTQAGIPLPDWVIAYLGRCSKRMIEEHVDTSDLRAVLPKVLEFPSVSNRRKKRGRGKPLNPYGRSDRFNFAMKFVLLILQGKDSKTARKDACIDTFSLEITEEVEDATLVDWLVDALGLEKKPQNETEWIALARWVADAQSAIWSAFLNPDIKWTEPGKQFPELIGQNIWREKVS